MTAQGPGTDGLAEFEQRLGGGVCQAIRGNRPGNQKTRDRDAFANNLGDDLAPLIGIRTGRWDDRAASAVTASVTQRIRAHRPLLAALLFSPDLVLDSLRHPAEQARFRLGSDTDAWIAMCLLFEAAWEAVTVAEWEDPAYAAGDAELFLPVAARVRFLVLTEPMRWRGATVGTCWARPEDEDIFGEGGVLDQVFGSDSWHLLVARCLEARRAWLDCLDAYQSHPLLSQAGPGELEDELATLLFDRPGTGDTLLSRRLFGMFRTLLSHRSEDGFSWRPSAPLGLSVKRLDESALLTAGDRAVITEAGDRHLLPRFALPAMIRFAFLGDSPQGRLARVRCAVAAAVAGLAAVGLAAGLLLYQATIAAAVFYLVVCAGVVAFGSDWAAVWLLRMPAASAVGVIALVSFLPGDWLRRLADGWLATLALAAASFGYLVMEVRNHGVAPRASVRRALAVTAVGAAHALMVSLIGLVVVAPAFVSSGPQFALLWQHPGYRHAGLLLALATAWCLAVGVFSQILWDDRPITAPLAHLSWRNRLPTNH
ncbi:MAG: hypothetical protein ACRDPY_23880 [Streptosporangiaceae bacterium]